MSEYNIMAPLYDVILYPFVHPIRQDVLSIVRRLHPHKVLDVCCGTGNQLRLLKRHGLNAVGIDLSPAMVDVSRKGNHAPTCFLADATAMTFDAGTFDLVMVSFALHEAGWQNAKKILEEIYRVLAVSGTLLLVDYSLDRRAGLLARKMIPWIEFMAGRRHYQSFLNYRGNGGLESLVDGRRFVSISETYHGMKSIVVKLLRKRS